MRRVSLVPEPMRSRSRTNVDYGRRKSIAPGRRLMGGGDDGDNSSNIQVDPARRNTRASGEINLDQVTANVKLNRLQTIFDDANAEGAPGLSMDEFKSAIRRTLHKEVTDNDLDLMFMKMDANCDGSIDWEEYVTYNLLEYKEKNQMMQMLREKPFPNDMKEINTRNHEAILRVSFYPHLNKRSTKIDYGDGKYATITRDGIISFWTMQMKHVRSFHAAPQSDRNTQPWYVDMACLYNNNMLAVASTDRDITFFDMSTKKLVRRYMISGLEDCITCMDCRADLSDKRHMVLIWGDTAGNIFSVNFEIQRGGAMFGSQDQKKDAMKKVSFAELIRGYVPNAKAHKLANVHDDWVCKVQYIPELKCILSCCQSSNSSLFMGDMIKKKTPAYFKVNKGLLCFDYCPILNIIVTGGMDYNIRIWNPYVVSRAIILLKGHTKPIVQTILNGRRNMVISIDKGNTIRIHDLKDQSCLQHISGRIVKLGPFSISAVCFNKKLQQLILATNKIAMLEHKDEDDRVADVTSHTKPIVAALYNETFNVMVSACEESVVSVWDVNKGEKIMQFINAHSCIENGVEVPVDITAMEFDTAGRRIITGAKDGSVKVWNFNNGQCLQTFQIPDSSVITGIASSRHRIYVTGWSRNVNIYVDGGGNESRKVWQTRHKEDILSIAYFSPNIIATSSYDGDIIVWSRDTGHMYCRLNAHEGVLPINDNFKQLNDDEEQEENDCPDTPEVTSGRRCSAMGSSEGGASSLKTRKSSLKDGNSPRKNLKFGILGKLKEEEDGGYDGGTPVRRSSTESCEHPLLRALDEEMIDNAGRFKTKKKYSREEYEAICRTYEAAVEKILFLKSREALSKKTAILITAGAEGWVRAWSIHHQGGLLGQFNAAHKVGDAISTIGTDAENRYLFTGDTSGYIKIWDLVDYCTSKKMSEREEARHLDNMKEKFTFLRVESAFGKSLFEVTREARIFNSRPPPIKSRPDKTVKIPRLLNSFRAHTRPITCINYIDSRELMITSSVDCSIRLWTVCGRYIGTFGEKWKRLPKVVVPNKIKRGIPKEVRRVGSARTLRVLNGGRTPHWDIAMRIIRHRGIDQLKNQLVHLQKRGLEGTKADKTEKALGTSNILGKSYKRKVRHKLPPVLPKLIETPSTIAVYHSLPFVDLSPTDFNHSPEVLEEINKRRLFAAVRSSAKTKGGVIAHFNKVVAKPVVGFVKPGPTNRLRKIVSRHKRHSSNSGTPDTDDVRSSPTSCPSTVTSGVSPEPGSKSSHRVKLPPLD